MTASPNPRRNWVDSQPHGRDYRPAFTITSFPSWGVSHRTKSAKAGRVLNLVSRLEFHATLWAEFRLDVVDIREQYPAATRQEAGSVARKLGFKEPQYSDECGLTTDLLLTVRDGTRTSLEAVSCKYEVDQRDRRVVELLAIAREIWVSRGVRVRDFSEESLSAATIHNLLWILPFRRRSSLMPGQPAARDRLVDELKDRLRAVPAEPLAAQCAKVDAELRYTVGFSLACVRWALAQHIWSAHFDVPYTPTVRVGEFLWITN